MLIAPGKLTFGEPEKQAIEPILRAIEEGMDVDGLLPEYRAVLADLHIQLGLYVGVATVEPPNPWKERQERWLTQVGPGGIDELRSVDYGVRTALTTGGYDTVFALDDATDQELLAVTGIGPGRLARIRAAIDRWRDVSPADVAPDLHRQGET